MRGLSSGERKYATVLFADIVDSSRLVAGADPEEANDKLLPWLEAMVEVIESYGGTVTQLLGDGVMALFGAPLAQEHHAVRACLAAREIHRRCAQRDDQGPHWVPSPVQLRVGISSGEIVAQPQSGMLTEYRAVGEPVHLAARAEQSAEPGQVLMTEKTHHLVAGQVVAHPGKPLRLSETARSVKTFVLDDVIITKRRMRPLESKAKSAFVGRQADLEALHENLAGALAGNGGAFIITGDPGVGKSRLIAEYIEAVGPDVGAVLKVDLEPTGVPRFEEPVACLVRALLELEPTAKAPELEDTVSQRLEALKFHGPHAKAAVLEVLGKTSDEPGWRGIDPPERLRLTLTTIADIVRAVGRQKAIVVILEDFHWATSDIQLLAGEIATRLDGTQVQFILTSRTHHERPWMNWPRRVQHGIGTLAPADAASVVAELLEASPELSALTQRLYDKTMGNPFFIEECLRTLVEREALEGTIGRYRLVVPIEEIEIPVTVHGVLAERIDSLPQKERQTLLCAAIIGRNFDVSLLQRLLGSDEGNLQDRLARLEQQGFIQHSRIIPNVEYTFRHALIHEVAYGTLLKRDRLRLHASVMNAIRRRPLHELPIKNDLMAYHAFRAEAWPYAAAYCRWAACKAQSASRNGEAAMLFDKALKALDQLPMTRRNAARAIDIRLELVQSLFTLGRTAEVGRCLETSVVSAETLEDELRLGQVFSAKMLAHWIDGDLEEAIRVGRQAFGVGKRLDNDQLAIQIGTRLGSLYIDHGDYGEACQLLEEIIARIPGSAAHKQYGVLAAASVACRGSLARALGELGRFREALNVGDEAIQMADETGHSFSQIYACLFMSNTLFLKGDFPSSLPLLERAHDACMATQSRLLIPLSAASLGYCRVRMGDVEGGLELLQTAVNYANEQVVKGQLSQQMAWLAEACLRQGQPVQALTHAKKALEIAKENGGKGDQAWAHWIVGEALLNAPKDSSRKAAKAYREALKIAESRQMRPLIAHCSAALAQIESTVGSRTKALTLMESACNQYEALGMASLAAQARGQLLTEHDIAAATLT